MSFWKAWWESKSRKEQFTPNLLFDGSDLVFKSTKTPSGESYPRSLDMRDLVLKTEDQGQTGMCAAYTATSWLEALMWRKTGKARHYDPEVLYWAAKAKDGMPEVEGTTLGAVMEAMIDLGWCEGCKREDIVYIHTIDQLKRAIHRYGTALLGMNISSDWYGHSSLVLKRASGPSEGGHAVICTGYNDVGVFIQNSWGESWGKYGFACIAWSVFNRQFMHGTYFKNCLDGVEE